MALGCKPARGATEFSYAVHSGLPNLQRMPPDSTLELQGLSDVAHVKRWEGDPMPSAKVEDEWRERSKAERFAEVRIPMECYVGTPAECPRSSPAYVEACVVDLKLPSGGIDTVTAEHRAAYLDLTDIELVATAYLIRRKAAVM